METGLRGKHVLITGANGGIGQATAVLFDKEGAKLSLHYHQNETSTKELESKLKGDYSFFQANLSSDTSVKKLMNQINQNNGRLDILIVNHGIWPENYIPAHDMTLQQWDNTIAINLTGAFLCSKHFLKNLEAYPEDFASITYVGSTAGIFGEAGHVDYSVTKFGLQGLVLSLKNEIVHLAYHGRVNLVAPGWTITPMTEKFMQDHTGIKSVLQTMPLRKLARAEDIASTILFLSSDKLAGHISGQIITVAGGMEGRKLFESDEINIDKI
ncbi:SDR family NAD(P)-dependent oxidoreductase [Candidatus Hodarchaeum mangrovi]